MYGLPELKPPLLCSMLFQQEGAMPAPHAETTSNMELHKNAAFTTRVYQKID